MRLNIYALIFVLFSAFSAYAIQEECPRPQNITISDRTESSVKVQWDSESTPISWTLEYGEAGFNLGEGTQRTSYLKNFTITGLQPGTNYRLYIKANCGGDDESSWSYQYSFSTAGNDQSNPCPVATSLSATEITENSATISWNSQSDPLSWEIEYGETGFTPGEGTTRVSYFKNISLNNLKEGILYDVYITSNCAGEMTGHASQRLTFRTTGDIGSGNIISPINEAVDNYTLQFVGSGNAQWFVTNSETIDGVDAIRSGQINHRQSSTIQTTVIGPGILTFNWKVSSEGNFDYLRFYIDGNQQERISGYGSWIQKEYSISEGEHTLTWSYTKDGSVDRYDDCGYVDNIMYASSNQQNSGCSFPMNIHATQTNATDAQLVWESYSTPVSYTIEYGVNGFNRGEGNIRESYIPSYQLTNLEPGTQYDVYINANCAGGESSAWNIYRITTDSEDVDPTCTEPYNITSNPISPYSVSVKWNGSPTAVSYSIEYGKNGFTQGEGTMVHSYFNDYTINGLEPGTNYDIYIRTNCGNEESAWIWNGFTTPSVTSSTCPTAYNLTAIDKTLTSATIEWQSDFNPVSWTIEYMPTSMLRGVADEVNRVTSYLKSYQLTNLEPGTEYYVSIQANCGSGDLGMTRSFSFTTKQGPQNLPIEENFDSANRPNLPSGWNSIGNVQTISSYYISYPNCIRFLGYKYNNNENILVSPEIVDPLHSVKVSFSAYITNSNPNQIISIGTMSDPNDANSFTAASSFDITDYMETYQRKQVVAFLKNITTDKYVAVKYENNSSNYYTSIYIDNFVIEKVEDTPEPTNLMVSRINDTSIALSWQDNAYGIQWEIAYTNNPRLSPDEIETRETVFMQEAVIQDLDPHRNYIFYVRVAGSNASGWSIPGSIDAAIASPAPQANVIGSGENTGNESGGENVATAINTPDAASDNEGVISVYPNPVSSSLYVKGESLAPETEIEITDLGGKTILKSTVKAQPFDLSTLPEGIYLLKVNQKIIKVLKK